MPIRLFITNCISHICFGGMVFLLSSRRYSVRKTTGILTGVTAVQIMLEIAAYYVRVNPWLFGLTVVLRMAVAVGTDLLISEYRDCRGLFTGLFADMCLLAGMMIPEYFGQLIGNPMWTPFLGLLIHLEIMIFLKYFFVPIYRTMQSERRNGWMQSCIVTVCFYMSAWAVAFIMYGTSRPQEAFMAIVIVLATVYILYCLMFWMVWRLYRERQAAKSRELLEKGISILKYELQELRDAEQRIAVHVHDRRHLIRLMQQLMAEKDYSQVSQVLEQMKNKTELEVEKWRCSNPAVNGVLASYETQAKKEGLQTDIKIDLPQHLQIDGWEIAAVTGGLMAYGIQMCRYVEAQKRRWLQVDIKEWEGKLKIQVSCSCKEKLLFHPETGLPIAVRGVDYGSGLQSLVYYAEKRKADFGCGEENGVFTAWICIQQGFHTEED